MSDSAAISSIIRTLSGQVSGSASPVDEKESDFKVDARAIQEKEAARNTEFEITEADRKAERRLVWRLDLFMLSIGFVGYAIKYLDQINISSAYVSGMQDDLSLYGNELNWFTTYFNIGYMVMLYPSCIIVSHIGPSIWLPSAELVWGVLTCFLSLVQNAKNIYALRALIGLAEATSWPCWYTLLSVWYHPHEIALRMAIFDSASPVGAMMSGALQGALATNLDGSLGRAGWRWAFIINGTMTLAVAIAGFFLLPGYPTKPNPLARWWLKDEDVAAAIRRNNRIKRSPQKPISFETFINAFKTWHIWLFASALAFGMNYMSAGYLNLWLQSLKDSSGNLKYSVAGLNYIPIGGQAISFVAHILLPALSDYFGKRLPFLLLHGGINIISQIILYLRPANFGLHLAGYYLNGVGIIASILVVAWGADAMNDKPEALTLLFTTATVVVYLYYAFVPLWWFPSSEAPNWKIGNLPEMILMIAAIFLFLVIGYLVRRDKRRATLGSL